MGGGCVYGCASQEGAITVNGRVRHRRKSLERPRRGDHSAPMPRPKLPREVVDTVVELLLCGWTPQDVVASWPGAWTPGESKTCVIQVSERCPSLASVQNIAKTAGLARPKGGGLYGGGFQPGHKRVEGSGRKLGSMGPKWSPHRDEVRRLRAEGHSLRAIAGLVGLRSPQQVSNLLSDDK